MTFEPKHVNKNGDKHAQVDIGGPAKVIKRNSPPLPKKEPKGLPKEKKAELKELKLPADGFVNGYGFLKVRGPVLEKLGWNWKPGKGNRTLVTLDVQDGALIIKKKGA